jgi:hypothetical protein
MAYGFEMLLWKRLLILLNSLKVASAVKKRDSQSAEETSGRNLQKNVNLSSFRNTFNPNSAGYVNYICITWGRIWLSGDQ